MVSTNLKLYSLCYILFKNYVDIRVSWFFGPSTACDYFVRATCTSLNIGGGEDEPDASISIEVTFMLQCSSYRWLIGTWQTHVCLCLCVCVLKVRAEAFCTRLRWLVQENNHRMCGQNTLGHMPMVLHTVIWLPLLHNQLHPARTWYLEVVR